MEKAWRWSRILAACACGGLVVLAGCGRPPAETREARNRHLRRAYAAREAQDIDGAIRWCQKALERTPDLALAHREAAIMLDQYREDYAAALYHYRRYLELRPDTPQREAVEDLIRRCRISLAAQVAGSPAEWQRELQARNDRIRELERELAQWRETGGGGVPEAAADPKRKRKAEAAVRLPGPASAAPAPEQVHVVQAGENLATISLRYYGTRGKWKTLFDANRDRLSDANNLRVGTTLTIPRE